LILEQIKEVKTNIFYTDCRASTGSIRTSNSSYSSSNNEGVAARLLARVAGPALGILGPATAPIPPAVMTTIATMLAGQR